MRDCVYILHCPPGWLKTAPLSLSYLYTYLKNQGVNVKILDLNTIFFQVFRLPQKNWLRLNYEFENGLFREAEKNFPPLFGQIYENISTAKYIGFSITTRNLNFSFALAGEIKKRYPEKIIIFGGPQVFFLDRDNKLDNQYHWVIGEGEKALTEIAQNENSEKIHCFREIENLDSLPFLDFSPINLNAHSPAIPVLSSRGCPYHCGFCSERLLYKKFRSHSPQYMAELINYLRDRHLINTFIFCDSLINYENGWLENFCRLVIKNNLNIKWEAQIRVDGNFPLSLARLMKQSGCYNLFVGLESGSDKILSKMNKGFGVTEAKQFFETLTYAGLHFEISLITGHPGETEKDFSQTIKFIKDNKNFIPKIAQINPFVDYLNSRPDKKSPAREGKKRVEKLLKTIEKEKIKYTKSFINNLAY